MPKSLFLAAVAAVVFFCGAASAQNKKVLLFTKSAGYEHSVVSRGEDGSFGLAERTVVQLGKKHGFDVVVTKDGRKINAEYLKNFDVLFMFTQGDLLQAGRDGQPPMRDEDRPAILEFVKQGGGFVGTHCGGADTFHGWPEFLEMVGGEFIGHGPQQEGRVDVVDPNFPAVAGWPSSFSMVDEWYAYRGFHANMRVLMMLRTEGLDGGPNKLYDRADYPITWCSNHGDGRVFYTGMGHREDVWENALYQNMVAKAVLWSAGKIEGDASPNLEELFGDADAALTRLNP